MILLDHASVIELLPMAECIELMAGALAALARGDATLPLRKVLRVPERDAAIAMMPALLRGNADADAGVIGIKAITVYPGNRGTAYESHQGAVLLFEAEQGRLLAIADASTVTAVRTAAVSGVATRLLARADAGDLALLGAGVQAATHLEAMRLVRPLRRVRAWSRSPEKTRSFAERMTARFGVEVEPMATAREAVAGADIICTVTSAREPVLMGDWLADGAHVNAVGSSTPAARELDSAAVVRARLYVDRRESTLAESGDFLVPLREGLVTEAHIVAELGDVLVGRASGRGSSDEVTLFKSLGLAVEDAAAARHLHERALATGKGLHVHLGGAREE